jgi:GLPGLI family protein
MALAQQKSGRVIYEKVSQFLRRFNINGVDNEAPQTRKDKFELTFGNNQSLWTAAEPENNDAPQNDQGLMQIRLIDIGSDDVLYCNFDTQKQIEKKEFIDKHFIVTDSIRSLKWKMTGETKTLLKHNCTKAIATRVSTKMQMNINNGVMERKEIQDTSEIIAWFTNEIPVSAGPAEFQGQLPGLILELNIADGKQTFIATSIFEKADLSIIKEPIGKKHYTPEEFKKERDKMMEEMQKNNQNGFYKVN